MYTNKTITTAVLLRNIFEAKVVESKLKSLPVKNNILIVDDIDKLIAMIAEKEIDCFIIDWEYDGPVLELTSKLRKSCEHRRTPLVFITNEMNTDISREYSSLNIDKTLSRPLSKVSFDESFVKIITKKTEKIIPETYNILVVDDNTDALDIISVHMEEMDHLSFSTATGVKEAKEKLDREDYNFLILDWNLGDGTCFDIIEYSSRKRKDLGLTEATVMVITGRDDIADVMTLVSHNVTDSIIKPFNFGEFEDKLMYAIEKRESKVKAA